MDSDIIKQKKISGGKLVLIEYRLDRISAEALSRPIGSNERVLQFVEEFSDRTTTSWPSVSWYLKLEDYVRTFNSINKKEDINCFFDRLNKIKDEKTAKEYSEFLLNRGHKY